MKLTHVKRQEQLISKTLREQGRKKGHEALLTHHIRQLEASDIDTDFASANGVRSVTAEDIKKIYGWQTNGGGLEFRYMMNEFKYYPNFSRTRLDVPVTLKPESHVDNQNKKKTVVRYLSPKDGGNHLYILKPVWPVLHDPSIPIFIVEGEKKTLLMVQLGYMAIGVSGIWNGYSDGQLIPDFNLINLKKREINIIFDRDTVSNIQVRRAEQKLAYDLHERAIR